MWNYQSDEQSNPFSTNSASFKCKISITRNTYNVGDGEDGHDAHKVSKNETEIVIPLKHLIWSKSCVLADMTVSDAKNNNYPPAKLYVTFVTLLTENDKKLLEQLKSAVKRL